MRAAVLSESGLSVRQWDDPEPESGEARVALTKVGICGSDVHFAIDRTLRPTFLPIVLGHEAAGTVESLGPDTAGPAAGTRVAIAPLVTCGECDRCRRGRTVICRRQACLGAQRHGCWAQYVTVPVRNLIELPASVGDELGAVATDCVATAYHALRRGGVSAGSRVAVWGVGGLGLAAVGIAKALGAQTVIAVDPRPRSRRWALKSGATDALPPERALKEITGRGGVDVALELVGSTETCEQTVRCLDVGGRAVLVGLGTARACGGHLTPFVQRELELVASYGAEPDDIRTVIEMMADGRLVLPHLLAGLIPLEEISEGLARVHRGDLSGGRLVVDISASARSS
jgi:2-desacetyl-2-hydroxyethyl bacteriochlorophyllide A dehydrogenase